MTTRRDPFVRNVTAFAICEVLWGFGMTVSSETATLPIFLRTLGASSFVIGLLPALSISLTIGQLFSGFIIERMHRTKRFVVGAYSIAVLFYALMAAFVFGRPALRLSNGALLAGLMVLFALLRSGCFFAAAPYFALMGRSLDPQRRGLGYGLIFTINTLAGMAGAVFASVVFDTVPIQHGGFALCLTVTFFCTAVGNLFILFVREAPKPSEYHPKLVTYLTGCLKEVWHTQGYRYYIIGKAFLTVYPLLIYFYVVESGVSASMGSILVAIQTAGSCLGVIAAGRIGDRYGYKLVAIVGTSVFLGALLIMITQPPVAGVGVVAFLSGCFLGFQQVSHFGLVLELCPRPDATIYFGIVQTVLAPFAVVVPPAGGYLIDRFSYPVVLGMVVPMTATGIAVWSRMRPGNYKMQSAK
ncbi:MAG: MFS transporter [Candidatus Latescibacteria bacterium]|nr:MFS transporter [Candidatus Latescibacterota bacterium]